MFVVVGVALEDVFFAEMFLFLINRRVTLLYLRVYLPSSSNISSVDIPLMDELDRCTSSLWSLGCVGVEIFLSLCVYTDTFTGTSRGGVRAEVCSYSDVCSSSSCV